MGDPVFPFLYKYLGAKHWNEYSNACFWEYHSMPCFRGAKSLSDFIRINKNMFFLETYSISSFSPIISIFLPLALVMFKNWNKLIKYLFFITFGYYIFFIFTSPQMRYFYPGLAMLSIIIAHFVKMVWTKYSLIKIPIVLCIVASFPIRAGFMEGLFFAGLGVLNQRKFHAEQYYKASIWASENLPQDAKILSWSLHGYYLDREYLLVNPVFSGILDFGKIKDTQTFLKSIKELGITHLLCNYSSPFIFPEHAKEFLNKCVSELLESGEIIPLKKIDNNNIYSTEVPQDYFVLDDKSIRFSDESQRKYLVKGWSSTEEWGTWSEGKESVILVNFTPTPPSPSKGEDIGGGKDYTMLIKATGFSVPGKQQSVKIYLDDNLLGEHTFTHPVTYFEDIEVKIPSAYIKEGNQQIRFVYSFTGSPAEYGVGPDVRQLAMGVSSIEFK